MNENWFNLEIHSNLLKPFFAFLSLWMAQIASLWKQKWRDNKWAHTHETQTRDGKSLIWRNSIERLVPKKMTQRHIGPNECELCLWVCISFACETHRRPEETTQLSLVRIQPNYYYYYFISLFVISHLYLVSTHFSYALRQELLNHDAWLRVHIFIMDVAVKMTLCNRPTTCPRPPSRPGFHPCMFVRKKETRITWGGFGNAGRIFTTSPTDYTCHVNLFFCEWCDSNNNKQFTFI